MRSRLLLGLVICALVALGAGCGMKEKPITELQRKEAAHLASEADFAVTLKDYPRAESVLAKVTELAPDTGSYWISLGVVRKRQGNMGGAKEAYQKALRAYESQAKKNDADSDAWLRQIYVLVLLGRADEARSVAGKMEKRFPNNRNVKIFVEEKHLDQMLADPMMKDNSV